MNRERFSELRVLSGIHAGARAPLGDGPQILGSHPDCDFILNDDGIAAQHVRIERQDDGSVLLHWLEEDAPVQRLLHGDHARIGTATITIAAAGSTWDPESSLSSGSFPTSVEGSDGGGSLHPSAHPALLAPRLRGKFALTATLWITTVLSVLSIAGLSVVWWSHSPAASTNPESEASAAPPNDSNPQSAEILAIAKQLGLADRVSVEPPHGSGPLTVRAGLLTEDQAELLASALTGLSPRPALRIANERETVLAVSETVRRHAHQMNGSISAKYLGDGRFSIEGRVPEAVQKVGLLDSLRAQFVEVRVFEDGLRIAADVADGLLQDLRSQGVHDVEGIWQGNFVEIRARIAPADVPHWERALKSAAARHDVPFRAALELSARAVPRTPASPLGIRSVVGGDQPYVVLDSGERLFLDGQRLGWRLVDIGSQSIVLEGPGGQRTVLDR